MAKRPVWTRRGFLSAAASAGAAFRGAWPARASARIGAGGAAAPDRGLDLRDPVRPFPLEQVRLSPGPFRDARDRNSRYLLSMPQDRLLHTFRVNAGIPSSAEPLGGWEKPDCELRGHFTGGHYLSACALTYAATGDEAFRSRARTRWSRSSRSARRRSAAATSPRFRRSSSTGCDAASRSGRPSTPTTRSSRGHLDVVSPLRQRAGARDGRGDGGVGAQLDQGPLRRAHGADPDDRVRRHERRALRPLGRHGQGGVPRARAPLRPDARSSTRSRRGGTS